MMELDFALCVVKDLMEEYKSISGIGKEYRSIYELRNEDIADALETVLKEAEK